MPSARRRPESPRPGRTSTRPAVPASAGCLQGRRARPNADRSGGTTNTCQVFLCGGGVGDGGVRGGEGRRCQMAACRAGMRVAG
eukprot:119355-Chlamydomonas_euryale.AAC.2